MLLWAWAALQAAGDHTSISALSVGLLAARPNWPFGCGRPSSARRERAQTVEWMAGVGKAATPAALRSERGGNDEGPKGRRRRPESFPVQPTVADGDCRDFVCGLSGKGALAIEAGGAVSPPHQSLSCMAGRRGRDRIDSRHGLSSPRSRPKISCCRMVLVPGQPSPDDRAGTGGRSGNGGSLRLHPVRWLVSDRDLAGGGLGQGSPTFRQMACHSRYFLSACAGGPDLPSSWLLARHSLVLATNVGADSEQLRRA